MFDLFGIKSKKKIKELDLQLSELKSKYDDVSANLDATSKSLKDNEAALRISKRQLEECRQNLEDEQDDNRKKTELLKKDEEKFSFIAKVLNAEPIDNPAFQKFKELFHKDYMEYANNNDALASEADAVLRLQRVEKQLELLSHDPALLSKNIIALAGLFSSGKSSFMNSLLKTGEIVLPVDSNPTTAIATYVLQGEKKIEGFSEKGGKIEISNNIFNYFCHGQIEQFKFNMKKIIDHIVLKDDYLLDLSNCCFIDTPGFNSGDDNESDTEAAFAAIETSNAVLWFIDITQGTLRGESTKILLEIFRRNPNLKIYVILNKADQKSLEDKKRIMNDILKLLNKRIEGISVYTTHNKITEQLEENKNCYEKKSIEQFLNENNIKNTDKESNILDNIEQVFNSYINADNEKIYNLEQQLVMIDILNNSIQTINDSKDAQLSSIRNKLLLSKELKKYANVTNEFNDDSILELSSTIRDGLLHDVNKYKADIVCAHNLCFRMKESVAELFNHKIIDDIDPNSLVKEFIPDLSRELQKKYALIKSVEGQNESMTSIKQTVSNEQDVQKKTTQAISHKASNVSANQRTLSPRQEKKIAKLAADVERQSAEFDRISAEMEKYKTGANEKLSSGFMAELWKKFPN